AEGPRGGRGGGAGGRARPIPAPTPLPSRSLPAPGPAPRPPPGSILFAAAAEPLQHGSGTVPACPCVLPGGATRLEQEPAMETVVIVAIGVLATIFLASFVALVVVCRQRYCHPKDLRHHYDTKPIVDLMGTTETPSEPSELELDDVVITNPHIEAILENEDWVEDASVDDVVRSMYPPLDPKLLDARAAALLLSVSHLVLVTRSACRQPAARHWVERSLAAAEEHMAVLRQAAMATEPERPPAPAEPPRQEQSAI
ncbi:transmembrane protein 98, partial [Lamprotornis superbus]